MKYNFGENETEYSPKAKGQVKVYLSPKYQEGKRKAVELIESGLYDISEADFWILKNFNKMGTLCTYSGLIISHNGCLKINDKLAKEKQYRPSCVQIVENVADTKCLSYICDEQGIYEFGEVSQDNCMNSYPYAMVLKRLLDRVILKNSKIAFYGIMSEVESEEFKKDYAEEKKEMITAEQIDDLLELGVNMERLAIAYKVNSHKDLTKEQAQEAINRKRKAEGK